MDILFFLLVFNYADDKVFRASKFPLARESRITPLITVDVHAKNHFSPPAFSLFLAFLSLPLHVPASIEPEKSSLRVAQGKKRGKIYVETFEARNKFLISPISSSSSGKRFSFLQRFRVRGSVVGRRVETVPCQHRVTM